MITLPPLTYGAPPLGPICIGLGDDGQPAWLPVDEAAWSVGGMSRAGKSNLLAGVIRQFAVRRNTAIVLGDPKLLEFAGWRDRASSVAIGAAQCRDQARWIAAEVDRRYQAVLASAAGRVVRRVEVSDGTPHIVWILDECADVFEGREGAQIATTIAGIARKCLAAKITPILCTQRSDAEAIPTKIRANLLNRIGFACSDELHARLTFGQSGVPAHLIPVGAKGVGYYIPDGDRAPRAFRAQLVTDEQIEEAAARTAGLRVDLSRLGLARETSLTTT